MLSDSLGQEKFVEVFTHIHHAYITGIDAGTGVCSFVCCCRGFVSFIFC